MEWLKAIAPTIASAVAGPFGGLAYEVIAKVFNIGTDAAKDMLEAGKMTSDQLAQVKVAEIQLKQMEEQLGLNFEQLAVQDRMSARAMQSETKSSLVPALAILIIVAFIVVTIGTLMGYSHIESAMAGTLIGYLSAKAEQVVAFYFGSSAGSQQKNEMLFNSTPMK
jgi:hypothetical protein